MIAIVEYNFFNANVKLVQERTLNQIKFKKLEEIAIL